MKVLAFAKDSYAIAGDPEREAARVAQNLIRLGLGYVAGPTPSGGMKVTAGDGSTITIYPSYLTPELLMPN